MISSLLFLFFVSSLAFSQTPSSPRKDSKLFGEGELLLTQGEFEKALWRFKSVITEHPQSLLLNEAKFNMGICYTRLKRHKEAIRTLNELIPVFAAPARMVQLFTLLGDNYGETRDRINALLWYGKGLLVKGQPQEELKRKIRSVIDTYGTEEELRQIEAIHRGAYAGGYARFRLAHIAMKEGYDSLARKMVTELEREYRGIDYGPLPKELSETTPLLSKSKYSVGVILPLSGIYKSFGEKALQGIKLALMEKKVREDVSLFSLVIRDSKGSPAEAEKAVEELVHREKVIAILGPLLSTTVDRAARKAQQLKIPLLSLSQKDVSPLKGGFVFQNSLIPSEQIQTLVSFAFKELELRTYAVFYPNSSYGFHFKNLFNQEVSRLGGKVMGAVVYQEEQTDFRQEIKGFFKVVAIAKEDRSKQKEDEFKQNLTVDGLFIPDTHDRAGTILSQMAYHDIKGTTFLGTNAWNGPGLLSSAGKTAEGAIFVDAFLIKDNAARSFVDAFQKEYQNPPETLEAICYDGARFLREILQSRSPSSPVEVKEELRKIHPYQGVSGLKGFGEDGRAIRTLSILRVKNGQFEPFLR